MGSTVTSGSAMKALIRSTTIWDNHTCFPLRSEPSYLPQLQRFRDAGVTVVSINVGYANMPWEEHLQILSYMRQWIAQRPETHRLISTVGDIQRCKADGKLGIVFDIEGMRPVQNNLNLIQTFYELGVRWMLVSYNRNNDAGGGCLDKDTGLTNVGRTAIDEMERVGMVLCLSHTGPRTAIEALQYSRNPVIFSHSNPYGDTKHVRNISDELIRACADKGGVIGLSGFGPFLGAGDDPVKDLLRQLHYVIGLVGPDHVGLGLDYCFDPAEFREHIRLNPSLFPEGIADGLMMVEPEATGQIIEGLLRDGLTDDQITNILGGNWLRIATQIWR